MSTLYPQLNLSKNSSTNHSSELFSGINFNAQEISLLLAFVGFIILVLASILIANSPSNHFFTEYAASLNIFLGLVMIGSGALAGKTVFN